MSQPGNREEVGGWVERRQGLCGYRYIASFEGFPGLEFEANRQRGSPATKGRRYVRTLRTSALSSGSILIIVCERFRCIIPSQYVSLPASPPDTVALKISFVLIMSSSGSSAGVSAGGSVPQSSRNTLSSSASVPRY